MKKKMKTLTFVVKKHTERRLFKKTLPFTLAVIMALLLMPMTAKVKQERTASVGLCV